MTLAIEVCYNSIVVILLEFKALQEHVNETVSNFGSWGAAGFFSNQLNLIKFMPRDKLKLVKSDLVTDDVSRVSTRVAAKPYLDCDYRNKLDDETRAWLDKFNREYYYDATNMSKPLHNSKALRVSVHSANTSRRRDYMLHATKSVNPIGKVVGTPSPEDALIEMVDLKNAYRFRK